ncbi:MULTISPECIES: hypothetical protein [Nocardiopsidaceae]|uniref:Uncharacterized protein n=2 Tax=Nocardiopsidaceae TaxID=83676 RepID=A0A368T9Q3_9ACTN|nr:hypothetical protein [Marinitenerispora sediminis]RCV53483.1 hypothetical protein DEF23_17545 [Marinitenerispora sediminis]RCV59311.1 hypothetical protein DEF24_10085 [Marinitenerispora sediminis]
MYQDPHGQWQHGQQPYHHQPPYYPPQPPAQLHPRVVKSVHRQRGLGGCSHTVHLTLTVLTCGAWGLVWFCWWLFRVVIPRRKVTKQYYR